jgi:hypothetical protein
MKNILFQTIKDHVDKYLNINFRYNQMDWATRVWMKLVCDFTEDRIIALEKRVKELEG